MTRSASMFCSTPRPPQFGQAPNGLLNENSRGSISGIVKPDTGQANFSEKMMRSAFSLRPALALARGRAAPSANSTTARPSASLSACSSESASRVRDVGAHHEAVDHHVDVVGELLVERLDLGDLVELAVDLDALVALLEELGELLAVLALAAAHDRRQQIDAACLPAAPARGRPSARRSGSRSAGRSPASRARRRAPTAAACSRRSR